MLCNRLLVNCLGVAEANIVVVHTFEGIFAALCSIIKKLYYVTVTARQCKLWAS